jgi:hypothetical protein
MEYTWGNFKEDMRDLLLHDAVRKGKRIQTYINQLARAAIVDLQDFVSALRDIEIVTWSSVKPSIWTTHEAWAKGSIVVVETGGVLMRSAEKFGTPVFQSYHDVDEGGSLPGDDPDNWFRINVLAETHDGAHTGRVTIPNHEISRILIRRFPFDNNDLKVSQYREVDRIPWNERHILNESSYGRCHNSIAFGDDGFILYPKLCVDEKLIIEGTGIQTYQKTQYWETDLHDGDETIFTIREARACSLYIKAHLSREIDKDEVGYRNIMSEYQRDRRHIFTTWKDITRHSMRATESRDPTKATVIGGNVI